MFEGIGSFTQASLQGDVRNARRDVATARRTAAANAAAADDAADQAWAWKARADELAAEVAALKLKLAVAESDAIACTAQAKALLDDNPNTALRADTGIKFKSKPGTKSKLRLIYDQAFDAAAKQRGIANPEDHRIS
jgi:hypothetical protein